MNLNQINKLKPLLCFIDTETTSLNHNTGAIIELAIIIDSQDGRRCFEEWEIKPHEGAEIQEQALVANKKTREVIDAYEPSDYQFREYIKTIRSYIDPMKKNKQLHDKLFFIAYNAQFDYNFMRNFMAIHGEKYFNAFFWHPCVDIMQLAMFKLWSVRHILTDFKLWNGKPF